MSLDRADANTLAALPLADARRRVVELGLMSADGLDELLGISRSVIRDDPAAGERLAELVSHLATEAAAPAAAPRAAYLLAQGRAAAGEMSAALDLIDRARDGFDELGLTFEALRTNLGRTQALNEMGRHEEALAACDRTRAGPTAPPHGLCLMEVRYDSAGPGDAEDAVDEE